MFPNYDLLGDIINWIAHKTQPNHTKIFTLKKINEDEYDLVSKLIPNDILDEYHLTFPNTRIYKGNLCGSAEIDEWLKQKQLTNNKL